VTANHIILNVAAAVLERRDDTGIVAVQKLEGTDFCAAQLLVDHGVARWDEQCNLVVPEALLAKVVLAEIKQ